MGIKDSINHAKLAVNFGLLKKEELITPKILSSNYQKELERRAIQRGADKVVSGIESICSFISSFKR